MNVYPDERRVCGQSQFVTGWPQKVEVGYMKVICPKCQFENQADSSRVVCARCATIIEVRMDQGAGFDSNGKRQTARLPFASNSSNSGAQPSSQSLGGQSFNQNQDVYATRIGDDFDDVLDVPIQGQPSYPTVEGGAPIYEDVFSSPGQDQNSVYDYSAYERGSGPIDNYGTGGARQRETQDYAEPAEQEFMGWPVLPEGTGDEEEEVRSGRGGLFLRVGVIVGVFGVLCFLAYFFLGDFIRAKLGARNQEVSANTPNGNQPTNPAPPNQPPSTQPGAVKDEGSSGQPKQPDSTAASDAKSKEGQVAPLPPVNPPKPEGPNGRTETPKPAPPPSQPIVPPSSSKGNLTIQIVSFKDQGEANAVAARLNSATGSSEEFRVVKADIPGKGIWYRVQQSSGFASREAAMRYGNQLRSKNLIETFIVTTK